GGDPQRGDSPRLRGLVRAALPRRRPVEPDPGERADAARAGLLAGALPRVAAARRAAGRREGLRMSAPKPPRPEEFNTGDMKRDWDARARACAREYILTGFAGEADAFAR